MGLVTYIHPYIHTTYIHSCTTAAALARERPAGWLAGWLHSVNQPNVPETWSTLRLCLSLSLFSLPRSPHQISFLFPRWPCETVRAPGVGCTLPSPPPGRLMIRCWVTTDLVSE